MKKVFSGIDDFNGKDVLVLSEENPAINHGRQLMFQFDDEQSYKTALSMIDFVENDLLDSETFKTICDTENGGIVFDVDGRAELYRFLFPKQNIGMAAALVETFLALATENVDEIDDDENLPYD